MTDVFLESNPFDALPSTLRVAAAELANRQPVTNEDIARVIGAFAAATGMESVDDELVSQFRAAVGWAASYRAELYRYYKSDAVHCPAGRVDSTRYIVWREDIPLRRYVIDTRSDPLEEQGRYQRYVISDRLRNYDLVEGWWQRAFAEAFGDYELAQEIMGATFIAPYVARRAKAKGATPHLLLEAIKKPIKIERIETIYLSVTSIIRVKKYGLLPKPGFLPIAVVENERGAPIRIIALRREEDTIVIKPIKWASGHSGQSGQSGQSGLSGRQV